MRRPRRPLLAAIGGLALAGCLAGDESDSDDDRTLPPSGTVPEGYPDYNADRLVAFDEIDPEETAIYLEPSAESITESERITFTLTNKSSGEFSYNSYAWELHKRVGGHWYYVGPKDEADPLNRLEPGEHYTWDLSVRNDRIEDGRSAGATNRGLGGGEYAFGIRGGFSDGPYLGSIGLCARFILEADPLPVTTTYAITETTWDGDVLVADSDRGDPDRAHSRLCAYDLRRITDDVQGTRLIPETILRDDRLRDAIALSREHDADRVRLEEYDAWTPIFGIDDTRHYHYDGETYAVSTRVLGND